MTKHNRVRPDRRVRSAALFALLGLCLAPLTSCGSVYMDQVEVPGTKQRLIVGHNTAPVGRVWVMENGKIERVTIVRK